MKKIYRLIIITVLLNFMPLYSQEKIIFLNLSADQADSLVAEALQNNLQSAKQHALAAQQRPDGIGEELIGSAFGNQQKLAMNSFKSDFWKVSEVSSGFIQIRLVPPQSYKWEMNEPYYFLNVLITRRNK